jgi:hypothetical protein
MTGKKVFRAAMEISICSRIAAILESMEILTCSRIAAIRENFTVVRLLFKNFFWQKSS